MANLILRMDPGDATIDRSTQIFHNQKGWEVITEAAGINKLATIGMGETLLINGHGDPTHLGNKTVAQLAKLLADGGLRGPVVIELIACETGWHRNPFALNLKVELVQGYKIMCSVSAPTRFVGVYDDSSLLVGELNPDGSWGAQTSAGKAMYATTKNF